MFHDPTDPRHLTPEQRLDELTALLAAGVRRMLGLRPPIADSAQNSLDVRPAKSVHASRTVNASREQRRS
jgi:hypothetical protein